MSVMNEAAEKTAATGTTTQRKVLMLGPTAAGKTKLLHAAAHSERIKSFAVPEGMRVQIDPRRDLKEDGLWGYADKGLIDAPSGEQDATTVFRDAAFDLRLSNQTNGTETTLVSLIDCPGESNHPEPDKARLTSYDEFINYNDAHRERIESGLYADIHSALFCIPAIPLSKPFDLDYVLKLIVSQGSIKRIVVCITMFDWLFFEKGTVIEDPDQPGKLFTHYGATNDPAFASSQIRSVLARRQLGELTSRLNQLAVLMARTQSIDVKVFPVSAFGFIQGTGEANLRDNGRTFELLTGTNGPDQAPTVERPYRFEDVYGKNPPDRKRILWRPYQALEPLLYAVSDHYAPERRVAMNCFDWTDVAPG